jgi:hypothetical protein
VANSAAHYVAAAHDAARIAALPGFVSGAVACFCFQGTAAALFVHAVDVLKAPALSACLPHALPHVLSACLIL